jgi:hypothetical protein
MAAPGGRGGRSIDAFGVRSRPGAETLGIDARDLHGRGPHRVGLGGEEQLVVGRREEPVVARDLFLELTLAPAGACARASTMKRESPPEKTLHMISPTTRSEFTRGTSWYSSAGIRRRRY